MFPTMRLPSPLMLKLSLRSVEISHKYTCVQFHKIVNNGLDSLQMFRVTCVFAGACLWQARLVCIAVNRCVLIGIEL